MASSSSSFAAAADPRFAVTEEQFKLFHNIDRILFTRLVHNLRHNPAESMQVIAFWIWLERSGQCRQLVKHMLTWPDALISALADEAVLLLTCIENEELPLENIDVPLTQSMTQNKGSLKFFHENRLIILHGVTRTVNEVCIRAFGDILLQHAMEHKTISDGNTENLLGENEIMKELVSHYGRVIASPGAMSQKLSQYFQAFDPYGHVFQGNPDVLSNEIGEILSDLRISNSSNSEQEMEFVPADERTIFLTFSKGYPISENEIRDFFTRKFGDCIESIYMQEVSAIGQPLYARLVVYPASSMEVVLEGRSKAKFSINGKHVWARKYVRKVQRISPPRPSSSSVFIKPTTDATN